MNRRCNLGLIQDIVYEWSRTADAEVVFEAIETMETLWYRDEVWRRSDALLRRMIEDADPDRDVPF